MFKSIFSLIIIGILSASISIAAPSPTDPVKNPSRIKIIKDLKLLFVIYGTNKLSEFEIQAYKKGAEYGRMFYFRNSRGELNLSLTYLLVGEDAPKNEGPTFDYIVKDLRERGYVDNQFDGIFVCGHGLAGNWGGFRIFDRTGAAFGGAGTGGQLRQIPVADTNVACDLSWIFIHEFQHALDLAIAGGSGYDYFLHGHPYADKNEYGTNLVQFVKNPGGQHWDWEACTLRNFTEYISLPGATYSYIFALDSDGDGLVDSHPALPMDEKRFGTDPFNPDTDGDGLNDLEEFMADVYNSSDPNNPDSDGDGLIDGFDQYPTIAINPFLYYARTTPNIDGELDDVYQTLIEKVYAHNVPDMNDYAVQTYACWNEDTLFIYAVAPQPFTFECQLDTSPENGFWIGGDTFIFHVKYNEQPKLDAPDTNVWNNTKAVWKEKDGKYILEMALDANIGAMGVVSGQKYPEDKNTAMRLISGFPVAFNIAFDFPKTRQRALLTPPWSMISTVLKKPVLAPNFPTLRYSEKAYNTNEPTIIVEGVNPMEKVIIVNPTGRELGSRIGSGEVKLSGLKVGSDAQTGENEITAIAGNVRSKVFKLVIDTKALPPNITIKDKDNDSATIEIRGEANASAIIVQDGKNIANVKLDEQGFATYKISKILQGLRGEYFNDTNYIDAVFYRIDPQINFEFRDGAPIRSMVSDLFGIKWEGNITVPEDTEATFFLASDDGCLLYINDELVFDYWGVHGLETTISKDVKLKKGKNKIEIKYCEELGWAGIKLEWQPKGQERTFEIPFTFDAKPVFSVFQIDTLGNQSELTKAINL